MQSGYLTCTITSGDEQCRNRRGGVRKGNLLLIFQSHILRRRPDLFLLLVLSQAVEMDKSKDTQANAPADNDGDFSRDIAWSVAWTESLGTCKRILISSGIHFFHFE